MWFLPVLAATLALWIPEGVFAGTWTVLVTQSGKEFVCNDSQQDNGSVLKARTRRAKIEVLFASNSRKLSLASPLFGDGPAY